jgi:hypothetical protein
MKRFNKYFRLQSQKLSRKAKLITLLMFMILLAAAILIVNQEVIHHRIYHSLGNTIREWVKKETNGMYVLQYDSMHINTLKKQASLRNVSLLIDSSTLEARKSLPKNLYELTTPELFLDIKSIWNILMKDKMEFNGITIKEPSLTIFNLSRPDSASNLSLQSGDLYLKINKYLDEFNINKFQLTNGSIHYKRLIDDDQHEVTIDKIDVFVHNLIVDAANQTAETDRVKVLLKNPSFLLPDGLHKLEIDNILLDSKSERIELNEVNLYPVYKKLQEIDVGEVNLYSFNIPQIKLDGVDFAAAYLDNKLLVKRIYIPKPEIIIDTHKDNAGRKPRENNLFKQLSVLFNKIQAKVLLLEDGKVDFVLEGDNKMRNIRISKTTINIKDLDLDTVKYSKQNSHVNFDAFNMKLKNYHLILPDSIHELTAETIIYSSDSSRLSISDLKIKPSGNQPEANRIEAQIPLVTLDGLDAKKYMQEHRLNLSEINISEPDIIYYKLTDNDSTQHDLFNFTLKNNKIADLITASLIAANDINFKLIEKGIVRTELRNGDINLHHFNINNSLPSDSTIYLNSKEITYYFPALDIVTNSADEISVFGASGNITSSSYKISNLSFTPANHSYSFEGSDIIVKGLNLQKALQDERLLLDSVQVGKATFRKVDTGQKAAKKENEKLPVEVGFISLSNGKVILNHNNGFLASIAGIKGYINDLDLSERNINLSDGKIFTEKLLIQSKKNNMYIGASRAEINEKNIILYLPYIEPMEKGKLNFTSLTASQAALIDIDLDKLLNEQKLYAKQLKLLTMNFNLHKAQQKKNQKRSVYLDWDNILKDDLEEVIIDRVIASGPELSFEAKNGDLKTGNFEIELKKFNTNLDGTKHLLNAGNIRLKIQDIHYKKDNTSLRAGLVALDENRKLISLNSVSFSNDNMEISMPLVFAKRMDLKSLAEEDKLLGEELEIAGFNILYKSKGANSPASTNKLPLIHFDRLNAHQGVLTFADIDGHEFKMNNIRGQLTNFDTEKNAEKPFYAENLKAKAGTFTGLIKDQMDRLLITGITISNNGRKLHLDHLYIKPEYEKMKYAYQVGHEANWMNMNMEDITIHEFDIEEALKDKPSLRINKVDIKALKAQIYRDKKLPFPQDKYTPLPQQELRDMKMPLFIDSIRIRSADITYQELGELAFEPGELKFQQLDVLLTNITNIPEKLHRNDQMMVKIVGSIEGTSLFTTASFDLLSEDNDFTFAGKMGGGGLLKFNKILENNAFLRIEKGHSRGITFNMKANNNYAAGKMIFYYRNLKISVIDKKTNKTSGLDESIASFFANTFVINSNNPSLLVLKEGNIYFKRDKAKSIFNYWAKSFLSGVVSSMGVKNHKKELKEALLESEETE